MFLLALMEKVVRIKPHEFGVGFDQAVERHLNCDFSNKVVPNLGLCIVLFDIVDAGVSHVLPGDGCTYTRVKFRFVVFRPFVDEIIEAKVLSSSREGLQLSLTFFDDIFVPAHRLPQSSFFEEQEQVWYWDYQQDDGECAKLYMDPGKVVRFRVVENIFRDIDPDAKIDDPNQQKSYEISGSMAESGLGCVLWWIPTEEATGEEEQGEQNEETME